MGSEMCIRDSSLSGRVGKSIDPSSFAVFYHAEIAIPQYPDQLRLKSQLAAVSFVYSYVPVARCLICPKPREDRTRTSSSVDLIFKYYCSVTYSTYLNSNRLTNASFRRKPTFCYSSRILGLVYLLQARHVRRRTKKAFQ